MLLMTGMCFKEEEADFLFPCQESCGIFLVNTSLLPLSPDLSLNAEEVSGISAESFLIRTDDASKELSDLGTGLFQFFPAVLPKHLPYFTSGFRMLTRSCLNRAEILIRYIHRQDIP